MIPQDLDDAALDARERALIRQKYPLSPVPKVMPQALDDATLEARELALIRKQYPYSPDPKAKRRGKLTRAEEAELFALARESCRRACARSAARWKNQPPAPPIQPRQLELAL